MLGNCKSILIGDGGAAEPSEEAPEEAPESAPMEEVAEAPSYSAPATVITGLGATPCPSSMRRGFGPKVKPKDSAGSIVMLLGVVALLACGAAAFMIMQMTA